MNSKYLLVLGVIYHLSFAIYHGFFWKLFSWKDNLPLLTPPNGSVVQILNLCLMFVFFIFAYISAFHASELLNSRLGKSLLLCIAAFWFLRAVEQVIFGGLSSKNSIVFFGVFMAGALLYLIAALRSQ